MRQCASILALVLWLTAHGSLLAADDETGLTDEEKEQGFVLLFNGEDLTGWQGAVDGYEAEEGVLVGRLEGGGNLYTEETYGDFIFRFEFKLDAVGNSGVGIRTPLEGDAAYVGMEIQVLDDSAEEYANLQAYQYHGSIYGVVAAERGHQNPLGEWNSEEIRCQGRHVTVTLNDHVIVDADLDEATAGGTADGREHPGLDRTEGHIGFLGHGHHVEFRNIRILPLTEDSDE